MAHPEKAFDPLRYRLPEELTGDQEGPCLSLYLPTRRGYPESQQNPIRFRNLLRTLRFSLGKGYPDAPVRQILKPFEELARNAEFWRNPGDGVAVFGSGELFRVFRLQRTVPERAVAAGNFHLKPLRRVLQATDRYQVIGLARDRMRLFEGNQYVFDEIEPAPEVPRTIKEALGSELTSPHLTVASYGGAGGTAMHHGHGGRPEQEDLDTERFFREVDRAVYEHHSRPSGLPLILAALPEHHNMFFKVSKNRNLVEEGIRVNPGDRRPDELRDLAWKVVEPLYNARLDALCEEFELARAKNLGSEDPALVAQAAVAGRVAALLVEADRRIAAIIDEKTGRVEKTDELKPGSDDLLDDLGEIVENMGGQVLVIPPDRMPSKTGIAAIYRY